MCYKIRVFSNLGLEDFFSPKHKCSTYPPASKTSNAFASHQPGIPQVHYFAVTLTNQVFQHVLHILPCLVKQSPQAPYTHPYV